MPSESAVRNSSRGRSAFCVLQRVLREHRRTIHSACLVNSSENTHTSHNTSSGHGLKIPHTKIVHRAGHMSLNPISSQSLTVLFIALCLFIYLAPSSCSRARASRRLLCSPRDGLCRITFNKPTTSVTRHQLDTRDSVHSRQELRKRGNQRGPRACVGGGTHAR